ncbi:helix-turn-helix domain-containing protein [Actinopolymorpha alba]|uniref:helix-turn-helix domain-containing protein n=1 Tax=Actinopolymorpha alba TaxID=533267 RepID=UPI000371CC30|nr:helix-turn-helix domain-containing protein [Actinopolymorpha alba]
MTDVSPPASATYAELAPPAQLAADVRCLWWSSFGDRSAIIPDGCLDLIVTPERTFVAGPDTRPWTSQSPVGMVMYGIRFQTGRASRVLGVPADALRDQRVDLSDLWGAAGRRATARLTSDPGQLAPLVTERLQRTDLAVPDRQVDLAVRRLQRGAPRVGAALADLADLDVSERQLRRRFAAAVGYGPATFLRVARLERVRHRARTRPDATLADLAADTGYADQAHLARDCRELAGAPPSTLLRAR